MLFQIILEYICLFRRYMIIHQNMFHKYATRSACIKIYQKNQDVGTYGWCMGGWVFSHFSAYYGGCFKLYWNIFVFLACIKIRKIRMLVRRRGVWVVGYSQGYWPGTQRPKYNTHFNARISTQQISWDTKYKWNKDIFKENKKPEVWVNSELVVQSPFFVHLHLIPKMVLSSSATIDIYLEVSVQSGQKEKFSLEWGWEKLVLAATNKFLKW